LRTLRDPTGGFEHGGWSVNYWDGAMGEWMEQSMGQPFDRVLDRKTYEIFAAHWPYLTRLEAVDTVHC
jgi:hypothetical protein